MIHIFAKYSIYAIIFLNNKNFPIRHSNGNFFCVLSHSTQQSAIGLDITEHWNMMQ